jgi:nucleoside-diphosphate-sugar epimerase
MVLPDSRSALIVGGAGFVGAALARELLDNEWRVAAVVRPGFRLPGSRLEGLAVDIIEGELARIGDLRRELAGKTFDAWYQFAWDGLFDGGLLDYARQILNIKYVMDAIILAADLGHPRFIGAGSIAQCELKIPAGQTGPGDKHQVYKVAKLACEHMGRSVAAGRGIEFFWPLITNIYGPGENSPRLINSMLRNLLAGRRQPLSRGDQLYDFIYLADAARAFRLIAEKGVERRRYVIASGGVRPLRKYLEIIGELASPGADLLGFGEASFAGIHLPREDYDIAPLAEDTGFAAQTSFAEGVRRTLDWIKRKGSPRKVKVEP